MPAKPPKGSKATKEVLAKLKTRWWWRVNGALSPAAGANFRLGNGEVVPVEFQGGQYLTHGRAAFIYEVEARIKQDEQKAATPVFRYQVPYPQLTYYHQKVVLSEQYPSISWPGSVSEVRPLSGVKPDNASEEEWLRAKLNHCEKPWKGIIDIHVRFDPTRVGHQAVLKEVKRLLEQKNPNPLRGGYGRTEEYQWEKLELADQWLAKLSLLPREREAAYNLLARWKKLL